MAASHNKVDHLMKQTGAGYDAALAALQKTDWEGAMAEELLIDGRNPDQTDFTATAQTGEDEMWDDPYHIASRYARSKNENFCCRIYSKWIRLVQKGNRKSMDIIKNDTIVAGAPLSMFIILLFIAFWLIIPVMIVALLFGFRYRLNENTEDETVSTAATPSDCRTVNYASLNVDSESERPISPLAK